MLRVVLELCCAALPAVSTSEYMSRPLLSSYAAAFALAGGSGVGLAHLIKGDERVGLVRRAGSAACVAVASTGMTFLSAKTVLARVSPHHPTTQPPLDLVTSCARAPNPLAHSARPLRSPDRSHGFWTHCMPGRTTPRRCCGRLAGG